MSVRRLSNTRGGAARILSEPASTAYTVEEQPDEGARDSILRCLLLATGSADGSVCVFDATGGEGSSEMLQKLEGHRDQVYCANFHPFDLLLASSSADCTVRLWRAKGSESRE